MSMISCQSCGAFIDSDLDPDCFVQEVGRVRVTGKEVVIAAFILCESCREQHLEEDERAL